MRRQRLWLAALVLLALVLALPLVLNLEAFHNQVHQALELELGREVGFESLTGRLLPRPGFVGRRVVVYDQEEFGAEPFLYAQEVRCDLSLRTLWTLRLAFSRIHFERPSINLVRSAGGNWNVATYLFDRHEASPPEALPVISVGQGRVNFKLRSDKQLYALRGVRLRLLPLPGQRWRLDMEATPFRTDQRLAEMGELRLAGEMGHGLEFATIPFQFQATYAQGSLAQLWALASGREPPVRATTNLNATVEGTPAAWTLKGGTTVSNLRRWDLVAPERNPRWQGDFELAYTAVGSVLEIRKLLIKSEQSQVVASGRIENLLDARRWGVDVTADLGFAELKQQWAALKAGVADPLRLDGRALARFSLQGSPDEWAGELTAPAGLTTRVPGLASPVQVSGLEARLGKGRLELSPLTFTFGAERSLELRGELGLSAGGFPYKLIWTSSGVELDPLRRIMAGFGWDPFGPDRWQGLAEIKLESNGQLLGQTESRWQGEVGLRQVKYSSPEFNQPLELVEARLRWQGPRFEAAPVVARLGENTVTASLRRRGRIERWNVEAQAERLSLEDLDQLLNPGRQGFLTRLVGLRPRQELRWKKLSATGKIKIGELIAGPFHLRDVEGRGEWMEGYLELADLRFRAYGGRFRGRLQNDFRVSPPSHRLAGNLKQADLAQLLAETTEWGGLFAGRLGADLALETQGAVPRELGRRLQGRVVGVVQDGTINHVNLISAMTAALDRNEPVSGKEAVEPTPLQSLAGEFRLGDRQVQLDGARMITSRTALELSGSVDFDGRLDLRLRGEPLRVTGRTPTPVASRALSYSYTLTGTMARPRLAVAEPVPSDQPAPP